MMASARTLAASAGVLVAGSNFVGPAFARALLAKSAVITWVPNTWLTPAPPYTLTREIRGGSLRKGYSTDMSETMRANTGLVGTSGMPKSYLTSMVVSAVGLMGPVSA